MRRNRLTLLLEALAWRVYIQTLDSSYGRGPAGWLNAKAYQAMGALHAVNCLKCDKRERKQEHG